MKTFSFLHVYIRFIQKKQFKMLVEFSSIFLVVSKIIFRFNFEPPFRPGGDSARFDHIGELCLLVLEKQVFSGNFLKVVKDII